MLMMGKSMDEYYRTNAAEYALMLIANHLANGMSHSEPEPEPEQPKEQKYSSMTEFLAARRKARG